MSIEGIRFRAEGALLVLQVLETVEHRGAYRYEFQGEAQWRDAKTEDMLEAAAFIRSATGADAVAARQTLEGLHARLLAIEVEKEKP